MSEPLIAQRLSQSVPIVRTVGGGIEPLAVDGIPSLKDIRSLGRAPTPFAFEADVQKGH
jgi:hypothetical protein